LKYVSLEDRIKYFCFISNQDLFLSKRYYLIGDKVCSPKNSDKEIYSKWTPASEWNWDTADPTDREIMKNEIVWETDFDITTNLNITEQLTSRLNSLDISYWVYFTGNKSYHIHFLINGLEKIDDGDYRKKLKIRISKNILGEDLFSKLDDNNFNKKKMIRLEGSWNAKASKQVELFLKKDFGNQESHTINILKEAIEQLKKRELNEVKFKFNKSIEVVDSPKVYCMLMEKALNEKFEEGNRHMNLCPNAVAILNAEQLKELARVQGMELSEFEGWKKKSPQFNCVQFRRYGATIGHKKICMECIRNSFNKNNW
jgi:hypothetical protein